MRASTADRERSIEVLKVSFVEGRLTRDELDERVGRVLVSRAFEELMALTADLPVGPYGRLPMHPANPPFPRTSRLAIAALICAVFAPCTVGLTAVPAILFGYAARRQIRRTGGEGMAAATAALVLGWSMALVIALTAVLAA
jgi:hypothetical protein